MVVSKIIFGASALAVLAAAGTPAAAQRVERIQRIVAFGDSYADIGNAFRLQGVPPPITYPRGRFSNGTNYVDTMSQLLQVPQVNFAVGGAVTGASTSTTAGFRDEYLAFLAGGGPSVFPRVSGTLAPTDLVVLSIGGNDARAYERRFGATPSAAAISAAIANAPAAAAQSVANTQAGLNALVGVGARNISFLAGDVGRLPEVQGTAIAPIGSAFSGAFNSGMQTVLAGYANQGVIVSYLDLNRIGDRIIANPAAYGLVSAGACPAACVTDANLANQYLFYVDQLHFTSAGFDIIGRYATNQVLAPLQFAPQADVGLETGRTFGASMEGRLDLASARSVADPVQGFSAFVAGTLGARNYQRSFSSFGHDVHVPGVSVGAEYGIGGAVVGAALNYSRGRGVADDVGARQRANATQLGAYAGWSSAAGPFVQAYAGYGWLKYRFQRDGVIDAISAAPSGHVVDAGGKAGWLLPVANWRIGPTVGLTYARATVDAYTETGDAALTLNVSRQSLKSLQGSVGVEARADLTAGGLAVRPFLGVAAEREFDARGRTILFSETAAPTIVNRYPIEKRANRTYARFRGGADLSLAQSLSLQVAATGTAGQKGGNDFAGSVGVKLGF